MQLNLPRQKPLRMSLTPLIDVVFLLLLFFMLSSTFLDFRSLPVTGVSDTAGARSSTLTPLVVEVGLDSISVNGTTTAADGVVSILDRTADSNRTRTVFIRPAFSVPLQRLVDIIEVISSGGFTQISLQE